MCSDIGCNLSINTKNVTVMPVESKIKCLYIYLSLQFRLEILIELWSNHINAKINLSSNRFENYCYSSSSRHYLTK